MKKVQHILLNKSKFVYSVPGNTTVFDALQILVEKNIGALVVLDGKKILGIFTERDYARKVVLKGKSSKEIAVAEIMNETPVFVSVNDSIEYCMELMTDKQVRYLLVLDKDTNELIGLLSIGDLVKFIMAEQQHTIDHLQNYIAGS
jgi:CBS domain-containing protein